MVSRNSTEDGLKQTTTRPIDCPPFTAHSLWMTHWMVPSKTQKHKSSRVLNRVQLPAETWSAAVWDPFSIYFGNSFLSRSVNEVLFSHLFHYMKFPFSWVRCSCVLKGWRVICHPRVPLGTPSVLCWARIPSMFWLVLGSLTARRCIAQHAW